MTQPTNSPSCTRCSLRNLCLPAAVNPDQIERIEELIQQSQILNKGGHVFRVQQPFRHCYVVRSGSLKTYIVNEQGEEQVTGFYLPGEIIGLDSVNMSHYGCSAQALERTSVCGIPFNKLGDLVATIPSLRDHFFQLMSKEILGSQQLIALMSKRSADERVIALLLSLSARFQRRGLSGTRFRLPMPQRDIANYLGLSIETVSRSFSRLKERRMIAVQSHEVTLGDLIGSQKEVLAAGHH